MPDGLLHYGLLGALAIALVVAAVTDLRRRQIDNWLTLAIALAAPLFWWASDLSLWPGVAIQVGMGLAAFAFGALLFAIRQMGGGDVKLIAALGLWFEPAVLFGLIFAMILLGWLLSLVMGTAAVIRSDKAGSRVFDNTWMVVTCLLAAAFVAALFGGPKLPLPQVDPGSALGWLVMMLPIIIVSIATLGAIRIIRRHNRNLRIPYGLAISVAGLAMIGAQFAQLTNAGGQAG